LHLLVSDLCYRWRVPDHVMLPAARGNVSANVKQSMLAWSEYALWPTWCMVRLVRDRRGGLIGERRFQRVGLADVRSQSRGGAIKVCAMQKVGRACW